MSANKESTGRYQPVAKAGMLIRKPVAEVFEALVNPAITSRFWFSKGSGRLEEDKQVRWEWGMYDFSVPVDVMAFLRLAASGYAREAFQKHVAPSFRHHNPFPGDAEDLGNAGGGWKATAGVHQGGLGGRVGAADQRQHITLSTGHHLRFNNEGQLMEITGNGIPQGEGRSHGAAAAAGR